MLKKKLNQGLWPMLVLFLVCLVSSGLLALTHYVTADTIAMRQQEAAEAVKRGLFPEAASFEALSLPKDFQDDETVDEAVRNSAEAALDADGKLLGLFIRTHKKGYGGQVSVYLAYDPEGSIVGICIPPNDETPGLGQRVHEEAFWSQFLGHSASESFTAWAGKGTKIDAVSGATVSSGAVGNAINDAAEIFKQLIGEVRK